MFLSQSESLCLQVQEQQVDLNLIACSAAMSARLSSSVWPVQLDLFPHVSSLRIHSTLLSHFRRLGLPMMVQVP